MNRNKLCIVDDGWGWAMRFQRRSGLLRTESVSPVSALREPAAIAGPSPDFIALTRNPELPPPARFEPTVKQPGDIVL